MNSAELYFLFTIKIPKRKSYQAVFVAPPEEPGMVPKLALLLLYLATILKIQYSYWSSSCHFITIEVKTQKGISTFEMPHTTVSTILIHSNWWYCQTQLEKETRKFSLVAGKHFQIKISVINLSIMGIRHVFHTLVIS